MRGGGGGGGIYGLVFLGGVGAGKSESEGGAGREGGSVREKGLQPLQVYLP